MIKKFLMMGLIAMTVCLPVTAHADDATYCEVIKVSGDVKFRHVGQELAPLQQGTMLSKGDSIVVGKGSTADLAFDPQWQNVTHLNENTRALIRFMNPTRLEIASGDIYAKLDHLTKGSTFEVCTPTAIASVRGTRYRTTYANGQTTVYNDSETSSVYVYHLDENGNRTGRAIELKPGHSIVITGDVAVYDTMLEELQDQRDREDQDQLNDDLKSHNELTPEQPGGGGGGYGGGYG